MGMALVLYELGSCIAPMFTSASCPPVNIERIICPVHTQGAAFFPLEDRESDRDNVDMRLEVGNPYTWTPNGIAKHYEKP